MKIDEILERKRERYKKLNRNLNRIVKDLINLGAEKIYLFGSLARGNINEFSDIDLFVVMPSSKSGKEWSKIIYEKVKRDVATDFIVFNKKEFESEKEFNPLIINILKEGKLIFKCEES